MDLRFFRQRNELFTGFLSNCNYCFTKESIGIKEEKKLLLATKKCDKSSLTQIPSDGFVN